MSNKTASEVRRKAKEEAEKDFAADWGAFWMVAGNWIGMYAMAILGFIADFAVAFSLIYGATKQSFLSLLGAGAVCAVIQYGYGGATYRITKAVKMGRISEPRYMRSAIIAGFFGLSTLGASLYLSYHFDSVFEVASEPQAEKEMRNEDEVNAYYDAKIAALRGDYEAERDEMNRKRNELMKQRNEAGEVLWTSRRSVEKIDTKQLPALREAYETSVSALEAERMQRLDETIARNEKTEAKWDARIMEGSMFTRWFNIAVNLVRLLLIVGWVVFLLDVDEDRQRKEDQVKNAAPAAEVWAVSNPPARVKMQPFTGLKMAETKQPDLVSNKVAAVSEGVDRNDIAKQLERARGKFRSYRSRVAKTPQTVIKDGIEIPNPSYHTAVAGMKKAESEIAQLEKELQ